MRGWMEIATSEKKFAYYKSLTILLCHPESNEDLITWIVLTSSSIELHNDKDSTCYFLLKQ